MSGPDTPSVTTSADGGGNGPAMSRSQFDELFDRLCRWERPTPPNGHVGYGAMGEVGPEHRSAAAALVQAGESVSLALAIDRTSGPDNLKPAMHHMVDRTDVEPPEPQSNKDFLGFDYHGKAVTHLDALCHIAYRGQLYGGVNSKDVVTSLGSQHYPVAELRDGIVARGVLLDAAAHRGVPWLEPGQAVGPDELVEIAERAGVQLRSGDAVLFRSGHLARKQELGAWNPDAISAGLHPSAMELFAERGTAVLGGDGDSDVRPSPVEGVSSPVHALALTALGIPLLDNLALERLSEACIRHQRWEFLLVVAPLVVPGGTGSPVNPLALF